MLDEQEKLKGLVEKIRVREESHARTSDKLAEGLRVLGNMFGHPDVCAICGRMRLDHKAEHKFVPRIRISIDVTDTEPFYLDKEDTKRLAIRSTKEASHLGVVTFEGNKQSFRYFNEESVEALKTLVKSKRIEAFLKIVSKRLEEEMEDDSNIANLAEKIGKAARA